MTSARADATTFRDEPAVRLRDGRLSLTLLPGLGLTGVSLRHDGGEYLALPGGLDALRAGHTSGLPLVAPWVNRLARPRFRAAGATVDVAPALADGTVHADPNGLPIHGLTPGRSVWHVESTGTRRGAATMRASTVLDRAALGGASGAAWRAFPFAHRLVVDVAVRDPDVRIATTIVATGSRAVPVALGWHPYLRVPGTPRARWRLVLPAREHLDLDELGIPTGAATPERAESAPLGRRTFDDLYRLGRTRVLAFEGDAGRRIEVRCGPGYPYAQVWVPAGRPFAALEPMAAPTDALARGTAPLVAPGDDLTLTCTFRLGT